VPARQVIRWGAKLTFLTRTDERLLVEACQGLEFLVLDELHTYRGRQGADVAMLVRRLRDRCGASSMRCVGSSATLASQGSRELYATGTQQPGSVFSRRAQQW
jgi:ATP-dependent helicase YprA (DUF1998 family)